MWPTRVRRVLSQAGDPAWVVTDYDLVRTLLTEPRLVSTHPDPQRAPRVSESVILGGPLPESPTEAEDHARMRRLLGRSFSAAGLERVRPRVVALTDEVLDDLAAAPKPADFHEIVSYPLPAFTICELFGVPRADREDFRRWSEESADMLDGARSMNGLASLTKYLSGLITRRLTEPGDDVLTEVAEAHRLEPEAFPLETAAELCAGLLFAGHETTVSAIDAGLVMVMTHPEQRAKLLASPELIPGAVEEMLRIGVPESTLATASISERVPGLPRWAKVTFDIDGVTIPEGDLVLLGLQQANHDPYLLGSQRGFEIERRPNPHLTFGHGKHYCIGAPLARLELRVLFEALLARFPAIEPAVPVDRLPLRHAMVAGGLASLPVTW
ncbi:cytochrome P450 [Amycolatopsis sp. cg5]|uniref:cytochrome P450 n=1 Tax=Amycolatopsis sp. cg5 TaxID=3238802 RepID=UPI00352478EC